MLADDVLLPNREVTWVLKVGSNFRASVRNAERFELDEAATRLVVQLATVHPAQIRRLLAVAAPPNALTWIEWSTLTMLDERNKLKTLANEIDFAGRTASWRTGVLVRLVEPGVIKIYQVDHATATRRSAPWPNAFSIALAGPRFPLEESLVQLGWGYPEGNDVRALLGRVLIERHDNTPLATAATALHEQAGITRFVIAALALLNGPATIDELRAPAGRNTTSSGSRPWLARRAVTVRLPRRVKDPYSYVVKRAGEGIRKRFHEVRAHWRYLRHAPLTAGWERVVVDDEPRWRRVIPSHTRGDLTIGMVEHTDATRVTGPQPTPL